MKKYISLLFAFTVTFAIVSCESDDDTLVDPFIRDVELVNPPAVTISSGTANFSTFVSVGNSITAGFSDGALFTTGQAVSFPNILAQQFAQVTDDGANTSFTQPLMNDDIGGLLLGGTPIAGPRLIFDAVNQAPVPVSGTPTTDVATNAIPGQYNNSGVPGAKSFHLLAPGYGNIAGLATMPATANPYFVRMASAPNATVLGDALAQQPSFLSLWIGNNDVLGYATSGGESDMMADNYNPITDTPTFTGTFAAITQQIQAAGVGGGIVANIPNVADAPFFTTVPFAPLDPTDPNFGPQIPTLNSVFGALNPIFEAVDPSRAIVFSETAASPVVIVDETLADISAIITAQLNASPTFPIFLQQFGITDPAAVPLVAALLGNLYGQTRQATADDLLLLTTSSLVGTVNADAAAFLESQGLSPELAAQFSTEGITLGLADKWVLLPSEQQEIADATVAFNQVIADTATQLDWPLFDVNTFFNEVATNGFQAGSAFMTADFVTGGTFSLDGIHPSPRGNAVIANQMIALINAKYGANLPEVNPVDFTGIYLN